MTRIVAGVVLAFGGGLAVAGAVEDAGSTVRVLFAAGVTVAALTLINELRMVRIVRELGRIERLLDERLERQRRWRAYSEALDDLGGINGEDSGEIPRVR